MMAQIEYEFSEISIHSFFAEADNVRDLVLKSPDISIHSFFAEADFMSGTYSSSSLIFQSTASSQKLTAMMGTGTYNLSNFNPQLLRRS